MGVAEEEEKGEGEREEEKVVEEGTGAVVYLSSARAHRS